ncbi:hypothetical protein SDC9_130986 [bioreactor metagenome]|uniref:Rubrerythrin diiron-binding domain-containing protein n=1 Tax=bioreactor metagenome TaxID=1076179 RepID=A0A645D3G7_9ZZZZ
MYPYITNKTQKLNNVKLSNAKLVMSEEEPTIQDMIIDAIKDEEHDFKYYSALSDAITDPTDAETVKSMSLDEYKHKRLLEEIYYALTGAMPQPVEVEIEPISNNLKEEFSNSLFKELEGVELYRELMTSFESLGVRDLFFEILTDEQSHADMLNYLIQK